jgi:hypothetical protein
MQAFTATPLAVFFVFNFLPPGKMPTKSPLCIKQQGAVTGRGCQCSLVIPFMTEIRSKKTGEYNGSQHCHKDMHISQHDKPPLMLKAYDKILTYLN